MNYPPKAKSPSPDRASANTAPSERVKQEAGQQLVNNRPEAAIQAKQQVLLNQHSAAIQLQGISGTAASGNQVIQLQGGMENEVKLDQTKEKYEGKKSYGPRSKALIVEDAIAARNHLRNMGGVVRPALGRLEEDIRLQFEMSAAEEPNTRHLTRALAVREKQCGLGATRSNYTRLLSADVFTAEAAKGALFNDWGALTVSMTHGEFTHRIQWYILMFAMSEGFERDIKTEPPAGFHRTPREFLEAINLGGVNLEQEEVDLAGLRPTAQKDGHGLWDVLFDRPALARGSLDLDNEDIGISDPERLMLMLDTRDPAGAPRPYQGVLGHLTCEAPELSRILTKRYHLRRSQGDPRLPLGGLDPNAFEQRKVATGRYDLDGRGLLVRKEPQSLVGSLAREEEVVPYAPDVSIN